MPQDTPRTHRAADPGNGEPTLAIGLNPGRRTAGEEANAVADHPMDFARAEGDLAGADAERIAATDHETSVAADRAASGSQPAAVAAPAARSAPGAVDHEKLRHHGDVEARPGMVDFAVNVQGSGPPEWLRERLARRLGELGRYPDAREEQAAREAVAARHGRRPEEVLLLSGAAEGFAMLPRLAPTLAAVIHPSFTEPELALREAGVPVARVVLNPPYTLDSDGAGGADDVAAAASGSVGATELAGVVRSAEGASGPAGANSVGATGSAGAVRSAVGAGGAGVPEGADLVVVGNPTNPTSVLHPVESVLALRRPGRIVVVDEAFADAVPGEPQSLAEVGFPDVLVLRSLTKTWALAGLRCGYFLGDPEVLARLNHGRAHWPLGTLQLEAISATATPEAVAESQRKAETIAADRDAMIPRLRELGIDVHEPARGPFLLIRVPDAELLRKKLADKGIAVRRGDTFPGLEQGHLRLAVRPAAEVDRLVAAIREVGL